jgi:hypothetical protein
LMCGYCGDGMEGPRESSNSNYIPCNDSNFVVNGDEKCYCPSDVIVYSEPGNGDCEPGEYDSGELNGCHTGALFPTSVCEYGVCEAGDCVALEIPTRMPSCGGTGWYNNDPCTNPDTQCYEDSCLGGAYCASGTCSGGTPVCCGDGVCNGLENCNYDRGDCQDRQCLEPTCLDGCGETFVPNRNTDEACNNGYHCNGDGSCVQNVCGDGYCDIGENPDNCITDCPCSSYYCWDNPFLPPPPCSDFSACYCGNCHWAGGGGEIPPIWVCYCLPV